MEDGDALKTARRLRRPNSADTASTIAERSKHTERLVGQVAGGSIPSLPSKTDAAGNDETSLDSTSAERPAKTESLTTTERGSRARPQTKAANPLSGAGTASLKRVSKHKGSRNTNSKRQSEMQDLVVFDLRSQNELLQERLIELVAEGSGDKAEIERLRSELD